MYVCTFIGVVVIFFSLVHCMTCWIFSALVSSFLTMHTHTQAHLLYPHTRTHTQAQHTFDNFTLTRVFVQTS